MVLVIAWFVTVGLLGVWLLRVSLGIVSWNVWYPRQRHDFLWHVALHSLVVVALLLAIWLA